MSPRGPSITSIFSHVTKIVLVYCIFHWSVIAPGASFDRVAIGAAIRLLGCALILSFIGSAVMVAARRWLVGTVTIIRGDVAAPLSSVIVAILALVLGQIAAMTWVYVRSGLSGIAYYLTGKQLPITWCEVLGLLAGAIYLNLKHQRLRSPREHTEELFSFVGVLICSIAPIALRDLPRTVALSSDPDQHAFWASQVFQLGIVPWDQGLTGAGAFGYPAGFATLNAVWMALSGLTATEIVTIQPVLQFLLAVLTCAVVAPLLYRSHTRDEISIGCLASNHQTTLVALCAIASYWFILPYGLQTERWHGEGTARLSTSLLSAVAALLWIVSGIRRGNNRNGAWAFLLATSTTCLIATFNPLSALIPLCLLACVACSFLWRGISLKRRRETFSVAIAATALACCILGGEPYLVAALANGITGATSSQVATPFSSLPNATFTFNPFATLFSPQTFVPYLSAGIFLNNPTTSIMAVLSLAVVVWAFRAPGIALRWLGAVWVCGVIAAYARGLQSTSTTALPLYLVAPYTYETALQIGAILGYILVMVTLVAALSLHRKWIGLALVLSLALWSSTRQQSISNTSAAFLLQPRRCGPDTPHCLTPSEQSALRYVEQLGLRIRSQYPGLTYASAPKVLILGVPKRYDRERWVFPSGAARVVTLYSSLPVAFFYGRGDHDWNFENYSTKICKRLDMEWLRQRNVRYLFLSRRDPGCMKHRKDVVKRGTILFEDAGARIVQLF